MSEGYVVSSQPSSGGPPPPPPGMKGYQPMPFPGPIEGVPPGLEFLATLDKLFLKQEISLMELLSGFETKNKYRVLNTKNEQAYWVFEESELANRVIAGPDRGFIMHVTDNYQNEVMSVVREFRCCKGCCWCADGCCMYPIIIYSRHGEMIGYTRTMNSRCAPIIGIFDYDDTLLYTITGPACVCQCCCCRENINYPIKRVKDDAVVGNISKIWTGALQELFTDSDTFGLQFPMDLEIKHKALMLGTLFLVDFAIFEQQKNN